MDWSISYSEISDCSKWVGEFRYQPLIAPLESHVVHGVGLNG
jgi:hypothetical protein